MKLIPCYRCGYPLTIEQMGTRCPECGSSDQLERRMEARELLRCPVTLALRALALWRPLPLALWSDDGDNRFVAALGRRHLRECLLGVGLAMIVVVLVGPFTVYHDDIVTVQRNRFGQPMTGQVGGPWWQVVRYDVWGEHQPRSWLDMGQRGIRGIITADAIYPRYGLCWYPSDVPPSGWSVIGTFMLASNGVVVIPLANYTGTCLLLWLVTRRPTARAYPVAETHSAQSAAAVSIRRACFVPIRLAWIVVFLMTLPLILAPEATVRIREIIWWVLIVVAGGFPCLIAVRAVLRDQAQLRMRRRKLCAALLIMCGAMVPTLVAFHVLTVVGG